MLYLVATPRGTVDDVSPRAIKVLREVDIVASKDTRKTGMLLKRFDIQKPQLPFHEHEVCGDREAALAHELTKMFESVERGIIPALLKWAGAAKPRGKYVTVTRGVDRVSNAAQDDNEGKESE
jgi:16S rRNA C1402 (ribose-2'-O) methylase RsmI